MTAEELSPEARRAVNRIMEDLRVACEKATLPAHKTDETLQVIETEARMRLEQFAVERGLDASHVTDVRAAYSLEKPWVVEISYGVSFVLGAMLAGAGLADRFVVRD